MTNATALLDRPPVIAPEATQLHPEATIALGATMLTGAAEAMPQAGVYRSTGTGAAELVDVQAVAPRDPAEHALNAVGVARLSVGANGQPVVGQVSAVEKAEYVEQRKKELAISFAASQQAQETNDVLRSVIDEQKDKDDQR